VISYIVASTPPIPLGMLSSGTGLIPKGGNEAPC
jgi:hypothetical protein